MPSQRLREKKTLHLLLLPLPLGHQSLHNLLLFDQKCPDDPLFDASGASRSTVGAGNGLLALVQRGILARPQARNARKSVSAVAALGSLSSFRHILRSQPAARRFHCADFVRLGRVAVATPVGDADVLRHCGSEWSARLSTYKHTWRLSLWLWF